MLDTQKEIDSDIRAVGLSDAVPMLLQVLCETTGMGFAAVARVTECNWTACAVRDEINFGLVAGSQLDLSTTLCRESHAARQAIVIDNVAEDPRYRDHRTPKLYGFNSYISVPIVLPNGDYFGNLCAIDPKPALVSDTKVVSMFTRFAGLIAAQVDEHRAPTESHEAHAAERALADMREMFQALGEELREPMHNLDATAAKLEHDKAAADIRAATRRMALLMDAALDCAEARFGAGLPVKLAPTDSVAEALNDTIDAARLGHPEARIISNIVVKSSVQCDLGRIRQLLSNLLENALEHGAPEGPVSAVASLDDGKLVIEVWNDGESIPPQDLQKILAPSWRSGLYLCAQVAKAHQGVISVMSRQGEGTLITVKIPI